jgi:CO dehydrogenase maturation factor
MRELVTGEREAIILDMEASIEHLSRGTIRHAQTLLIIVEPYYRALETAGRIAALAPVLGIPEVLAVGNKVRTLQDEAAISEYCRAHGIELSLCVPFDEHVGEADRRGAALIDLAPDSPVVQRIGVLAERLSQ